MKRRLFLGGLALAPLCIPIRISSMQSNFAACAAFTRAAEGGCVCNPADPGGWTNMGITRATLEAWRGRMVTPAQVRYLTWTEAAAIYGAKFWNPVRGDVLPIGVDLVVFDFAVNAGPRRSVEELQIVLEPRGVTLDGWIGPQTLGALAAAPPAATIQSLTAAHKSWYARLPAYRVFGRGWDTRADRANAAALAMLAQAPTTT